MPSRDTRSNLYFLSVMKMFNAHSSTARCALRIHHPGYRCRVVIRRAPVALVEAFPFVAETQWRREQFKLKIDEKKRYDILEDDEASDFVDGSLVLQRRIGGR